MTHGTQVSSALGLKGKRKLGAIPENGAKMEEMERWTRWSTHVAMLDRYDNMTQVCLFVCLSLS